MRTTPTAPVGRAGTSALLLLCLSQFMLVMDVAIVNVALPSIQRDLHFTTATLGLVITAHALTFGGLLLLGGRAADLVGRRHSFLGGLVVFTTASFLSGIAPTAGLLVSTRALQGVGAAFMAPAALALLTTIFPAGPARNRALGVWSTLAAGGGAAGLLLGGVVTDLASWRWIFLINVPIGIGALVATLRLLPNVRPSSTGHLDGGGALAVTVGLIAFVLEVERLGQEGWTNVGTILLLGGAFLLLTAFVVIERRVATPLVDLTLFQQRTLTGANMAMILMSAIILGVNYFLTLYFQGVLHYSPLQTGLAFLPITLISGSTSLGVARLVGHVAQPPLLLSGMLALGGGALLLLPLSHGSSYLWGVLPALVVFAVGLGIGYTVGTLVATSGTPVAQQGAVAGVVTTSQQLGGAVGLATLTALASAASTGYHATFLTGFHAAGVAMALCGGLAAVAVVVLVRPSSAVPHQMATIAGLPHTTACQPALTAAMTVAAALPREESHA